MSGRLLLSALWLGAAGCAAPEVVGEEGATPALCEVPPLTELYPGPVAPNPAADHPRAGACIDQPHDVMLVLGCPNNDDGSPAPCQIQRADIAADLYALGYAEHLITSGAAVHTPQVEADVIRDLLVERGVPAAVIEREPLAEHTDENIYWSSRIMQERGWRSALVISDGAGQLVYNALCDSNCCVKLGRLTVVELAGYVVGHYVLYPDAAPVTDEECDHIEDARMGVCLNLGKRRSCKDHFDL